MDNYLKDELFSLIKNDSSMFDFVTELSTDGLWYWDLEHPENEWMNARFWTTLGYNPDEMPALASAWQDIIFPEDLKIATENFKVHLKDPNCAYDQIVRYTHKDGSTVWIRCRGMAIRDSDGKPSRMLGVHQDITELKKTEEALKKSDEKYSKLFSEMSDGFAYHEIICNEKGQAVDYVTLEINKAFEQLLGVTAENVVGKKASAILSEEELTHWLEIFGPVALNGVSKSYEMFSPTNQKYFEGNAYCPERNKFAVTFSDVSERKQSELSLQQAKEQAEKNELRLKFAQEASSTGTWDWDIINDTFYWSDEFLKVFGMPEGTDAGFEAWTKALHPEDIEMATTKIQESIENKRQLVSDYRILLPNEQIRWIRSIGKTYYENDRPLRMLGLCMDITAQKGTELELLNAKEKAEENDTLKSAFLKNMSHEVRTPMNAIIGFSDLLNLPDISDEERKSYTEIITDSSNQLLSIITDILAISFLETKQTEVYIQKVCVNTIIADLQGQFNKKAMAKQILLSASCSLSDVQSEIYTDLNKLKQIIASLLSNALKFTHKGGIEFGYTLNGADLEFFVKDSGIGIITEMQDKIFEPFRQADASIAINYGGTGLGLSISKPFVELLGGKMWVQSQAGKGSIFYFSIPYKAVHEVSQSSATKTKNKLNMTILIAEDEESNYLFLLGVLYGKSVKIIRARNGIDAVDMCKENAEIDLVLMDIKMPGVEGNYAAKQIKEFRPNLPIIAQTAYALESEMAKYNGPEFDDYLTKPFKQNAILQVISKYIAI